MTFFSFFFRKKKFFLKKNFCTKIGKIPITIHYISHIFKPFLLMGGVGVFLSGWERERERERERHRQREREREREREIVY